MTRLSYHSFHRVHVVTDADGRLVAVAIRVTRKRMLVSRAGAGRPVTTTIYGLWRGPWPRVGDYVMAARRARCAYRIAARPRPRRPGELALQVERLELPLPPDARRVHLWRWDARGKNTGIANSSPDRSP